MSDRHSHKGPMGQWSCNSTSMSPDVSIKLEMAQIGPVVVELRKVSPRIGEHLNTYYVHGLSHVATMGKWPWCYISTCQDGSNQFYSKWARPVVAKFWHPQDSTNPYYTHWHAHVAPIAGLDIKHLVYVPIGHVVLKINVPCKNFHMSSQYLHKHKISTGPD